MAIENATLFGSRLVVGSPPRPCSSRCETAETGVVGAGVELAVQGGDASLLDEAEDGDEGQLFSGEGLRAELTRWIREMGIEKLKRLPVGDRRRLPPGSIRSAPGRGRLVLRLPHSEGGALLALGRFGRLHLH